jgi:hypothetical protein
MKRTLQLVLIAIISLFQFQSVNAQLTPKDLGEPKYNGQGNPKTSKFVQFATITDSVTYTQQAEGLNIVTKSAPWIPVTWYATSDSGFVANGAYTVEARVAIHKSMKNGFFMEMQGTPGKRVKIDIDTTAIYNMTYSPSTAKEVIANNLDNRGMHTYRVAVDAADKAHIFRDGVKVGTTDADGLVSTSSYYKDIEVIQDDQFFEDFKDLATAPHGVNNATLSANLSGNWDITQSAWCKIGIDTTKANVKVGASSVWFNNGTTGELKITKKGLSAGKYKLSFWSKTKASGEAYKGTVTMLGTDPNRPAVKYKDGRPDSIPAYVGTDPHVVVLASQVLVPDNRNFGYREYAFDVIRDRDILITFHNGWSNTQKPGWANIWFDDMRIAKVEPVPFIRFGKDSEAGVTDFTFGSLTYDLTGAYSPAPSALAANKSELNSIYTTVSSGLMHVNYTLANTSKANIQLVDLSGRVLVQQRVSAIAGQNSTSISTSNLKGIYLLRVITAEAAETLKVEVK